MKTFIKRTWLPVVLAFTLAACNDDFLAEKRDLTGYNEEVFMDEAMAKAYVGYIYHLFLPGDNSNPFNSYPGSGSFASTTEEEAGQTNWNREWDVISITEGHALNYFGQRMTTGVRNNTWTRLRQINIFLAEIDQHGLTPEQTAPLKGQMLFWRAYQYFQLLRLYGGVPLVLEPQNPITAEGSAENEVPRSSSSETLAQIIADLDAAAELLPGRWPASDWGRITKGAAMAFKGRVLLTWASPLFNRNDDVSRWQASYDANLAAKNELEANGFGLYSSGDFESGEAWENMWFAEVDNPEAVIVWLYNNVSSDQTQRNNGWERAARSNEIGGGGSESPTKQMLDAFPMKDGKLPGDPSSAYTYDPQKFYKDRDPRFYKTFVFNGANWPYGGDPEFRQWTYYWYSEAGIENPNQSTENDPNDSGIYIRKATNPEADASNGYEYSSTNFMEMRFAEVILNLAESAIGVGNLAEGLDLIGMVRERAGVENRDGDYGLSAASGSRDGMFAAVLNERKIELAYEAKRFWDLRRWMLFTDEHGTCSRLGVEPLQGTRRTGLWIYVTNPDGTPYVGADDPLEPGLEGEPAPLIARDPGDGNYPAGIETQEEYLDYLYDNYFEVIERDDLDPTDPADWTFTWYDEYYFFGFNQEVLSGSPYLEQTQGWPDEVGAPGTFDPLQ